jgi:hypothetical protein
VKILVSQESQPYYDDVLSPLFLRKGGQKCLPAIELE